MAQGKNEFLIFDQEDQNILTQEEYVNDTQRISGFSSGVARSKLFNKVLKQTSAMCAALGQLIAENGGDATEDATELSKGVGRLSTFVSSDKTVNEIRLSNKAIKLLNKSPVDAYGSSIYIYGDYIYILSSNILTILTTYYMELKTNIALTGIGIPPSANAYFVCVDETWIFIGVSSGIYKINKSTMTSAGFKSTPSFDNSGVRIVEDGEFLYVCGSDGYSKPTQVLKKNDLSAITTLMQSHNINADEKQIYTLTNDTMRTYDKNTFQLLKTSSVGTYFRGGNSITFYEDKVLYVSKNKVFVNDVSTNEKVDEIDLSSVLGSAQIYQIEVFEDLLYILYPPGIIFAYDLKKKARINSVVSTRLAIGDGYYKGSFAIDSKGILYPSTLLSNANDHLPCSIVVTREIVSISEI